MSRRSRLAKAERRRRAARQRAADQQMEKAGWTKLGTTDRGGIIWWAPVGTKEP